MGNDDLLSPGSLASVVDILDRHPDCGVILRSYSAFAGHRDNIVEEFRYFSQERVFNPGVNSAAILFRRSVVISGMVVNRKSASQIATERYDGSLLYQLYLVARIASCEKAVSTPFCIALYRLGGVPDFGNADCEIGIYVPGEQTVDSSFAFVSGMLSMSEKIEYSIGSPFAALVKRDSAIYSYPFIRIQRGNGYYTGLRMSIKLAQLGFWRSPYFLCYVISLLTIGPVVSDFIIRSIKRAVGHTPMLTKFNG